MKQNILTVPLITALATALTAAFPGLTPPNGVEISLDVDPHPSKGSSMPVLRIRIRNTGASTKRIVFGGSCGSGGETNAIVLEVTEDQRGSKQEFHDVAINQPCGGRFIPYSVALPPGADFSTPLSLENYGSISPRTHRFEAGFKPGRQYTVTATLPLDVTGTIFDGGLLALAPSSSARPQTSDSPPNSSNTPVPEPLRSNALHLAIPVEH